MEMKREVRVEKENEKEENMCTALLTALVILSMACLKHFSSLTYFIEQWRSLVFLLLNIVLLAVYFTSTRLTPGESNDFKTRHGGNRLKMMRSKKKKRACFDQDFVETKEVIKNCVVEEVIEEKIQRVCPEFNDETTKDCFFDKKVVDFKAEEEGEEEELDAGRLSNEELNERVEAFITTFRQHLVIDARRGRDKDRKEMSRRRESSDQKMRSNDSNEISFLARRVSCSV